MFRRSTVWLLLLAIMSSAAGADESAAERVGIMSKGQCVESRFVGYRIVGKIDDHTYELRGDGVAFERQAVLETKEAIFDTTGLPVGISIQRTGSKNLKMENGFSAKYQVWRECGYDENVDSIPHHGPQFAWPRVRQVSGSKKTEIIKVKPKKTNDCQEVCFEKESTKKLKKGETLESCLRSSCK